MPTTREPTDGDAHDTAEEMEWDRERCGMVDVLRLHGIRNERILSAMARVRRHRFIPAGMRQHGSAYGDHPWPIGFEQTISQPYIVAYMTERLALAAGARVLEVGTGSGYQSAVLVELGAEVYSIERVPELADHARAVLRHEGYGDHVHVMTGDGYEGWPEKGPFDAVICACAPEEVPASLAFQLAEGGRMMLPVGAAGDQRLVMVRKHGGRIEPTDDLSVRFVPMVKGRLT